MASTSTPEEMMTVIAEDDVLELRLWRTADRLPYYVTIESVADFSEVAVGVGQLRSVAEALLAFADQAEV